MAISKTKKPLLCKKCGSKIKRILITGKIEEVWECHTCREVQTAILSK